MAADKGRTWRARWIWTRGPLQKEFHFSYFRATFELARAPEDAVILCAADSRYRLWVNGTYVGFGPARGHSKHPYYDTHSVRLRKGRNVVALLVEHYTNKYGTFAAVEGGLIAEVEADGAVVAATDGTWRALTSKAYFPVPGRILCEGFDARREPVGWEQPGFSDRRWPRAVALRRTKLAPPRALLPRPIPLIREERLAPVRLLDVGFTRNEVHPDLAKDIDIATSLWECKLDSGKLPPMRPALAPQTPWRERPVSVTLAPKEAVFLMLDFGRNVLAAPELDVVGPAGILCDMGYSEILHNNRVATAWQEPHTGQAERIILREGRTAHRIHQPRGFRYMMLRIANPTRRRATVTLRDVSAHLSIYPAERRGQFRASDPLLEKIFALSAWTANLCMEDSYTDCPWRERHQWLGDFQSEGLFNYYCFGAYDMARKAALEFARGNTPQGWIPGVFPISEPFNLPTWGMRFPVGAWEYYLYTGDRTVLAEALASTKKQMAWLARYENRDGILVNLPGWSFVDWTALDAGRNDGAVQGWHLEALDASAKLARAAGDRKTAAEYERRAAKLRRSLARLYWSPSRGAFLKYRPGSKVRPANAAADLIGQHENFLFSMLKVGSAAQRARALEAVRGECGLWLPDLGGYQSAYLNDTKGNYVSERTILIGSPFWSFYALLSLMDAGKTREALDVIRLGWGTMIQNGATTCWEMWDRHTSMSHGWSAAPAMVLPAFILGVKPLQPGFRVFEVRPRSADLAWAEGTVPTPRGNIRVSWKRSKRGAVCKIAVPTGTRARFVGEGLGGRKSSPRTLPPGKHTISVGV